MASSINVIFTSIQLKTIAGFKKENFSRINTMTPNTINDKKFIVALIIAILLGVCAVLITTHKLGSSIQQDDWQFVQPTSSSSGGLSLQGMSVYIWIIFVVLIIFLLIPIISGIIYIVKGKKLMTSEGKQKNPMRTFGIFMLLSPFIMVLCTAVGILLTAILNPLFLFFPVLISIGLITLLIVLAKRHQIRRALIGIIAIGIFSLVGVCFILFVAYFGVLNPGRFMASNGLQYAPSGGIMPSLANVGTGMQKGSFSDEALGFSVGGAKDINNFRQNIENKYLPLSTDITYEGLYYDYYFDTGQSKACEQLFCPSYSYAVTKDPISSKDDYYLSVGLNSNLKESDFKRKKLNLVIVLDMSGSMSSPFNKYYYDQFGKRQPIDPEENDSENNDKSKMEVATESVVALLDHLNSEDRFGMVLFDDDAYLAKPLTKIGDTDMESVKKHILDIKPNSGTYMERGMKKGSNLFDEITDYNPDEYENRIIFLTDAMPNIGDTSEEGLLGITRKNADNKVYATFIGIGVDFNTELIDYITKMRGANYYSVHSANQFRTRMDDEFEFMVTPMVFNLTLNLKAKGYQIEKVYGSPEANESTGEIMKVNTLFPSKTENGQTKGGIIILKLKRLDSSDHSLDLSTSYETRAGELQHTTESIAFNNERPEFFQNTGIRKGILLARYADLMKNWINDERASLKNSMPVNPKVTMDDGIVIPYPDVILSRWERQSVPLRVDSEYRQFITTFNEYFEKEMQGIGDTTLQKEVHVMNLLTQTNTTEPAK
jgi:Ca-activated chloride channel homolog